MYKEGLNKYLEHLFDIFKKEPKYFKNESNTKGLEGVLSLVYENMPETGYVTAVTYGLSLVDKKEWKYGRPELCICVESNEVAWGDVIGYIANNLRDSSNFRYGEIINFKEKISDESGMSSFFISAPSIFEKKDYLNIDIGLNYKINIAEMYPIYEEEVSIYEKIGHDEFIVHPEFDLYNVKRKAIKE